VPLQGGFFGQEIGNNFIELPIEKDFEGDSENTNLDADLENMDKLFGSGGTQQKMPSKKFKEDDEDFFDSQFFNAGGKDKTP